MHKIFFVYIVFILIAISNQRNDYTLEEINMKYKMFVNSHKSKIPIGFNLSDNVYLQISNITTTYIPKVTTYDMFFSQIDYYDMDVYFVFKMTLHNGYLKGYDIVKNITVSVDNISAVFHFNNFQFYKLADNGFQYNHEYIPMSFKIDFSYIKEYELYSDLLNDEKNIQQIKNLLTCHWNQLLEQMLTLFPQCDALYYYIKTTDYLKRRGIIPVNYPLHRDFEEIEFQTFAYNEVRKVNTYTEEFIGVKIRVYYKVSGLKYNPMVFFNTIHVTRNEMIFGKLHPYDEALEDVMIYYLKDAFASELKKDN